MNSGRLRLEASRAGSLCAPVTYAKQFTAQLVSFDASITQWRQYGLCTETQAMNISRKSFDSLCVL